MSISKDADLFDTVAATLPARMRRDPEHVARTVLGQPAWWVRGLFWLRDKLAARVGLKTTAALRHDAEAVGSKYVSFFRILSLTAHEVVLGLEDPHVDYKTSIVLQNTGDATESEVFVTTIVHSRSALGRIYLKLVRPFHLIIVKSNLKRALQRAIAR
ncbi:DUF2867 domain-containing protein [Rhizobium sp. AB2/73]|uniref:DUF2867 domain-containing protein n=1 Tax=Rhizobium sp. AB2/73 TaxID=2795216 RepID=UPI001C5FA308|nr:DUF2867 domain-containing protein [Rhizobium sp. AB2/73]QYA13180.1 DUF2867 domain-containing protein [Rhizobium sp. AB2/73]UEQ80887.1 DUF2867 domain-containing protein [Rhizobium sp. AB2/73]